MNTSLMTYMDKAMTGLRDLGLVPDAAAETPITALLNQITELDPERVVLIARTLSQTSLFNEVVREQVSKMEYGERYEVIAERFNSIRDDAKAMVDQVSDGKIDSFERLGNVWMKVTRGDIATRFDDIKTIYLEVAKDTQDQIEREHHILEAYRDFRGALKESEILALEVLKTAEERLRKCQNELEEASQIVAADKAEDAAERARLELARDEKIRALQEEDQRYQITKDLSDNLTVGYNTSEVVMARLMQTTTAKRRVYAQSISFFGTNETVLTALSASFTGLFGLHESTEALNVMKEGIEQSLETLSDIGMKVQEAALKAGYGPTIRAEAVNKLVNSVIAYQESSREIIDEMRVLATKNSDEIRDLVEQGKRRLAKLADHSADVMPLVA